MLNLKESKQTRVGTAHYSLNGSNIFLILEFLIQNEGTYYERKDLNVYQILEAVGGLQSLVFIVASLLNWYFTDEASNIQLIGLLKIQLP